MRALRNTIFTTANPMLRDFVAEPKELQALVEKVREGYQEYFDKAFVKELLIKIVAGLVKEQPSTY